MLYMHCLIDPKWAFLSSDNLRSKEQVAILVLVTTLKSIVTGLSVHLTA